MTPTRFFFGSPATASPAPFSGGTCLLQILVLDWQLSSGPAALQAVSISLDDAPGGALTFALGSRFAQGMVVWPTGYSSYQVASVPFSYDGNVTLNYLDGTGAAQTWSGAIDLGATFHFLAVLHINRPGGASPFLSQHATDFTSRPIATIELVNISDVTYGAGTDNNGHAYTSFYQFPGGSQVDFTLAPQASLFFRDDATAYAYPRTSPPPGPSVNVGYECAFSLGKAGGIGALVSGYISYGPSEGYILFSSKREGGSDSYWGVLASLNLWPPTGGVGVAPADYWRPFFRLTGPT